MVDKDSGSLEIETPSSTFANLSSSSHWVSFLGALGDRCTLYWGLLEQSACLIFPIVLNGPNECDIPCPFRGSCKLCVRNSKLLFDCLDGLTSGPISSLSFCPSTAVIPLAIDGLLTLESSFPIPIPALTLLLNENFLGCSFKTSFAIGRVTLSFLGKFSSSESSNSYESSSNFLFLIWFTKNKYLHNKRSHRLG